MTETAVSYLPARCSTPERVDRRSGGKSIPCRVEATLLLADDLYCSRHGYRRVRWISDAHLEQSLLVAEEYLQDPDPKVRERAEQTVAFVQANLDARAAHRGTTDHVVDGPATAATA